MTTSVITCPGCGAATEEQVPDDACQFFWQCPACGELLRPRHGDCCVFCSYGSRRCGTARADRDDFVTGAAAADDGSDV